MSFEALEIVRSALKNGRAKRSLSSDYSPIPFYRPKEGLRASGEDALHTGRIAVLMPAGGLSTRIGGVLRLGLSIGPVTHRSILKLQLEKLLALRERYQQPIPLIVVTSAQVHAKIKLLFEEHDYCGLTPADVIFINQPSLPVIAESGEPVILEDGSILEAPAGHGSVFSAIASSKVIPWLRQRGVEFLFHFQYPNVMEQLCDPVFIGAHICGGFECTLKAFQKARVGEKVGRIVLSDAGHLRIVEYHETDENENYSLLSSMPVNLGTYIWSLEFLVRCIEQGIQLPLIVTPLKLKSWEGKILKAEQLIFDLLDYTHASGFVVVDREQHYGVVKYETGEDSLESARDQLNRMYLNWLSSAGAVTQDQEARIEISPLFALDQKELVSKIKPGFRFHDGLILEK